MATRKSRERNGLTTRSPLDDLRDRPTSWRDFQHLLWSAKELQRVRRGDIRKLACAGVAGVDAELHNSWHQKFGPPSYHSDAVLTAVDAIGRRHAEGLCSCAGIARVRVDAWLMRPVADPSTPECLIWEIDPEVFKFLNRYLTAIKWRGIEVAELRELYLERHAARRCACFNCPRP